MSWGGPISAHGMGNNSSFGLATLGHGTCDNNIGLPSSSCGRSNATGTIGEPFAASADGYEVNNADPYGSSSIYGDRAWRFSSSEVDMAPPFGYDLANIDQETKSKISASYMGNYTVNNNQASRGIVYKGAMPNSEHVAVKRLPAMGRGSSHDHGFSAEIQTLGRIRHRHIVRLLGFCSNNETNLLVYEYMSNGSLGELLHGKKGGHLALGHSVQDCH